MKLLPRWRGQPPAVTDRPRPRLVRRAAIARRRAGRMDPVLRGLAWSVLAGLLFTVLNAMTRGMALVLDPFQAQFLRYLMGVVVMLPLLVLRGGLRACVPRDLTGQLGRGMVHTVGLTLWFLAIPHISLADITAIGFTGPIFIMLGAALFLGERLHRERWIAAGMGLAGVLVVVGPQLRGQGGAYLLVLLASAPLFAASFLITKAQARHEGAAVIVAWQSITVSLFSLPLALLNWQAPSLAQLGVFLACGLVGSAGHYCLARSYRIADISATQSAKFLELVWAVLLGWLAFGDVPSRWTVVGGLVICGATVWIARREAARR